MAINEIEMKKGEEFADKFLSSLGNEAFCRPDFAVGAWLLLMERISNKAAELCREKEEELNLRGRIVAEIFYQKSGMQ